MQITHPGLEVVCPGYFLGFSSIFLEVPLGKLAAEEDFLFPMDGGPQGATSRELVEADGTGGSMPDVFTSKVNAGCVYKQRSPLSTAFGAVCRLRQCGRE